MLEEGDPGVCEPLLLEEEDEEELGELVVVVVLEVAWQDCETPVTGSDTRLCGSTEVPGGRSRLNVNDWPPTTVTVTVHGSAEAEGIEATPMTDATTPAAATAILSFLAPITWFYLLPAIQLSDWEIPAVAGT